MTANTGWYKPGLICLGLTFLLLLGSGVLVIWHTPNLIPSRQFKHSIPNTTSSLHIPSSQRFHIQDTTTTNDATYINTADSGVTIRHVYHHGIGNTLNLHRRLDIPDDRHTTPSHLSKQRLYTRQVSQSDNLRFKWVRRMTTRLRDTSRSAIQSYRMQSSSQHPSSKKSVAWIRESIAVPDVGDRETIVSLAEIASNAYIAIPDTEDWLDVGERYNSSLDFGWEEDGLRGHIWADPSNTTVIIGLKGTSPKVLFWEHDNTAVKDKINDNLLFSCCCARVSFAWTPVCGCYTSPQTCNATCLEEAVQDKSHCYAAALDIYYNVTALYPNANIWLVGHSLGGALAALTGLTFGVPTVSFEAPGDLLASQRLHLPQPPGLPRSESLVWHIGHTSDPVFVGTCTGPGSGCWIGGYALETRCHTGLECVYDTVRDKGWRVNLATHRMKNVIRDVILTYDTPPQCIAGEDDCDDCYQWEFVDSTNRSVSAGGEIRDMSDWEASLETGSMRERVQQQAQDTVEGSGQEHQHQGLHREGFITAQRQGQI